MNKSFKRKAIKHGFAMLTTLITTLLANGCYDTMILSEGGIGGTGISSGPISGFGSIYVNGVEFDTDKAEIYVNGDPASEEELQLGMVVKVYGRIDSNDPSRGDAERIDFNYTLQGEIVAIDRDSATLYTASQTILSDELTLFADGSLAQLDTGDFVAVSGLVDAQGRVMARYIIKTTFDPRLAVDTIMAPSGNVLSGDEASIPASGGNLSDARFQLREGDSMQLTAYIEEIIDENQIRIAGQRVSIDDKTRFIDGDRARLGVNQQIRVEAKLGADNLLLAQSIAFLNDSDVTLRANVTSIDLRHRRLTLGDIEVSLDNTTLMIDHSALALRRFALEDIGVGDLLNVSGRLGNTGIVLSRLERLATQSR